MWVSPRLLYEKDKPRGTSLNTPLVRTLLVYLHLYGAINKPCRYPKSPALIRRGYVIIMYWYESWAMQSPDHKNSYHVHAHLHNHIKIDVIKYVAMNYAKQTTFDAGTPQEIPLQYIYMHRHPMTSILIWLGYMYCSDWCQWHWIIARISDG